ncbi:putative amiloride-sensitive sodium channel subunit beta [Penaeus vannamei]|uniref:Putative amiloride-sensitive sodium channel subunit beta n=1 Tax=Penaeus vannamei TaxID=6689 RepID=A0A3R7NRC6_PENVA|nr:putative amiloride-sensitive sodium channel subunit beta [Penaeus vannamei]
MIVKTTASSNEGVLSTTVTFTRTTNHFHHFTVCLVYHHSLTLHSGVSEATTTTSSNEVTSQVCLSEVSTTPSSDVTSHFIRPLRRKKREDRRPPPRDDDHEEYEDLFQNYQEMAPSERHDLQMNFLSLYMDMPPAIKRNIGYSFDELIKDCDFLGRKCYNESQFHHHLSPTYGNCYIFNGAGGVYTSLTGPTYSLSLVVDIWEKTYLPRRLTKKVGARVAVHRPKTLPLLDDDAIDVGPKLASSIAIKELNLHRLEKPYEANCTGSWETTKYQYINRTYANVYTITDCLRMCLQRLFVDRCSCFHALYPDNFVFDGKKYIRFFSTCNLTSTNPNSACVEKSLKLYSTNPGAANCGCNVACNETQYPSALSMANWPPEASEKDVKADYGKEETDDMMRVDVFFHTLNVDDVTPVESMRYEHRGIERALISKVENVWGLVSSLGGALSLYMGISVFLLVEVLEFLIYLVVNSCMYVVGGYETQTEVSPGHSAPISPLRQISSKFSSRAAVNTPSDAPTLFRDANHTCTVLWPLIETLLPKIYRSLAGVNSSRLPIEGVMTRGQHRSPILQLF